MITDACTASLALPVQPASKKINEMG